MRIPHRTLATGFIALSLLALAACGGQPQGRVAVVLSSSGGAANLMASHSDGDCAAPTAASVTFSSLLARNLQGELVDVDIDLSVPVDLLSLVNGKEATLPIGSLPPGDYDQFVVVMRQLELTLASGTKVAITPPGGGWTAIVPVAEPFTVTEGQTTTVLLNFRMDLSFGCNLGKWDFQPRFEWKHRRG